MNRYQTSSWRLAGDPVAALALGGPLDWRPGWLTDNPVGWGLAPSGRAALAIAQRRGKPALLLEDGFYRSCGGPNTERLATIVEAGGCYYDPAGTGGIVAALRAGPERDPRHLRRAETAIAQIVAAGLSKYNTGHVYPGELPGRSSRKILVLDQVRDDRSVLLSAPQGAAAAFRAMLACARAENPGADLIIKGHPVARGYLADQSGPGVYHLTGNWALPDLLPQVEAVYCFSSQGGFDALLRGQRVVVFGQPFYAGWGLTEDRTPLPGRDQAHSRASLFACACLRHTCYQAWGRESTLEEVLDILAAHRQQQRLLPLPVTALGFSRWKRWYIGPFLARAGNFQVEFASRPTGRELGLVSWGGDSPAAAARIAATGCPSWRVEDGFIRSRGLGSQLVPPLSLCLDRRGIYFDPRASDLTEFLAQHPFSDPERARGAQLRELLIAAGVGKYNTGGRPPHWPPASTECHLIIGQVEGDRSLAGSPVQTNAELVAAVRRLEPAAQLVYREHPDVTAGTRPAGTPVAADLVSRGECLWQSLELAAAVHVMTSLAGFEALLRGKRVICHGRPFYWGWGLTSGEGEGRGRRLTLDELCYGCLVAYPHYLDPTSGRQLAPEEAVARIAAEPAATPPRHRAWRWLAGVLRG